MSAGKPYSGIPLDEKRAWIVPRWLKEAFVGFAIAALLAVGVSKYLQLSSGPLERAKAAVDAGAISGKAPAILLPRRGGGTFDLSQARGKLTLVNLWATWCPPCVQEMPSLGRLAQLMDPQSLQVVAVTVDKSWAPVDKFFEGKPTPYAIVLDADSQTSLAYGTNKFPETYLVDAEGNLKLKFVGPRDWSDQRIVLLLEQLGAKRLAGSSGPEPKAHSG